MSYERPPPAAGHRRDTAELRGCRADGRPILPATVTALGLIGWSPCDSSKPLDDECSNKVRRVQQSLKDNG